MTWLVHSPRLMGWRFRANSNALGINGATRHARLPRLVKRAEDERSRVLRRRAFWQLAAADASNHIGRAQAAMTPASSATLTISTMPALRSRRTTPMRRPFALCLKPLRGNVATTA